MKKWLDKLYREDDQGSFNSTLFIFDNHKETANKIKGNSLPCVKAALDITRLTDINHTTLSSWFISMARPKTVLVLAYLMVKVKLLFVIFRLGLAFQFRN